MKLDVNYLNNKFDEISPIVESTLEEPHDDDMMSQGHGVMVELEGVGVG